MAHTHVHDTQFGRVYFSTLFLCFLFCFRLTGTAARCPLPLHALRCRSLRCLSCCLSLSLAAASAVFACCPLLLPLSAAFAVTASALLSASAAAAGTLHLTQAGRPAAQRSASQSTLIGGSASFLTIFQTFFRSLFAHFASMRILCLSRSLSLSLCQCGQTRRQGTVGLS